MLRSSPTTERKFITFREMLVRNQRSHRSIYDEVELVKNGFKLTRDGLECLEWQINPI